MHEGTLEKKPQRQEAKCQEEDRSHPTSTWVWTANPSLHPLEATPPPNTFPFLQVPVGFNRHLETAQTYSWCGAPVLVSRVSTKNIKITKTARPTQNPITMESVRQLTLGLAFHSNIKFKYSRNLCFLIHEMRGWSQSSETTLNYQTAGNS